MLETDPRCEIATEYASASRPASLVLVECFSQLVLWTLKSPNMTTSASGRVDCIQSMLLDRCSKRAVYDLSSGLRYIQHKNVVIFLEVIWNHITSKFLGSKVSIR